MPCLICPRQQPVSPLAAELTTLQAEAQEERALFSSWQTPARLAGTLLRGSDEHKVTQEAREGSTHLLSDGHSQGQRLSSVTSTLPVEHRNAGPKHLWLGAAN